MTIQKSEEAGKLIIALEGRLDTTTAPELEAELSGKKDAAEIEFDFSKLEYISSAGLRVLLSAQKAMNANGGKMTIRNVSEDILEVFEITGFVDILTIV